MTEIDIQTERIDDIPLLIHQQRKMGIPEVLDQVIHPHGNRQGLSVGWLTTAWLSYILSEADHRMSVVEEWAAQRMDALSRLIPHSLRVKDFTDDRLADVLSLLSDDRNWEAIECQLGQRLVRVYDLKRGPVRLDSTAVAVYHDTEGNTLFQHGHSKDHRPDLAQFKVMLASLDPLGMPVATMVVAGNRSDDGLYLPAIIRARQVVNQGGRLYVGDVKMGALATRAFVEDGGDYYLMPLARTGKIPELLRAQLEQVRAGTQRLQRIRAPSTDPSGVQPKLLSAGYETGRMQKAEMNGRTVTWQERLLVVFSPSLARRTRRGLLRRLERAEQALLALTPLPGRGKRQWEDLTALQSAAQAILKRRRGQGLLDVTYRQEVERRTIRKYRDRPARTEERIRYVVQVTRNPASIQAARRLLGWRLYVTNAPAAELSLTKAVWVYRGAPTIERGFGRLKGHPLGLRPLFVRQEEHAKGMVRLLSLGLRALTVVEHVVREGLQAAGEALTGLYPGNPKRQTARPTTERLLKAFKEITLTVVNLPGQTIHHVTPLSYLQQRILALLGLSTSLYDNLASVVHSIPP